MPTTSPELTTCKSHTSRKLCAKMNLPPTTLKPVLPSARLKATPQATLTKLVSILRPRTTLSKLRSTFMPPNGSMVGRPQQSSTCKTSQQNRTYNPTPGRHTAAAQTTELFIQKKLFTNACNNIAPRAQPTSAPRNSNGAAGGAAKGGHRTTDPGQTPAPHQSATRARRPGDASAATNLPPADRGGSAAHDTP